MIVNDKRQNNKQSCLFLDKSISLFNLWTTGFIEARYHLSLSWECNIIDEIIVEQLKDLFERNIEKKMFFLITPQYHTYWEEIHFEGVVVEKIYNTVNKIINEYSLL